MVMLLACSEGYRNVMPQILNRLKNEGRISDYVSDIPNVYIIYGSREITSADEISKYINSLVPEPRNRYIITEIAGGRQGWLPKSTWDAIRVNDDSPSR